MFSHIMVGANDVQAAKVFYDAVLGAMGHNPGVIDPHGRCFYITPAGIFFHQQADRWQPCQSW
jgi:catechol 2,3-dioxygenase-like lactoylglutathione lyase family enzyme